jgi:uncharacterized BrkB/YihY/UPF0761 family membrane protein
MARRVAESAAALVALRNVMQRVQQACDHAHRPASQLSSKHIPFVLLLLLLFFFFFFFLFFFLLFFTLLELRLLDFTQSLLRVCFSCLFNNRLASGIFKTLGLFCFHIQQNKWQICE